MKRRRERPDGQAPPKPTVKVKPKPTVKVKPDSYQPTPEELDEDISIDGVDPDDLIRAVLNRVQVEETDDA